jgi:hypothetical protein
MSNLKKEMHGMRVGIPLIEIIMTDDLKFIYWDGYNAYLEGLFSCDNPYYSEDEKYIVWENGWNDAAWDD